MVKKIAAIPTSHRDFLWSQAGIQYFVFAKPMIDWVSAFAGTTLL